MIKKTASIILIVCIILTMAGCAKAKSPTAESISKKYNITKTSQDTKIIIDTDLMYLYDDTMALFGYLKAEQAGFLEILGITTVGGNSFTVPETYDVLNILDYLGRSDIPVAMGTDVPLDGFQDIDKLFKLTGKMHYCGAYSFMDDYSTDYSTAEKLATSSVLGSPVSQPIDRTAVDFMIEQVHKYPGKVTVIALGACTNVAQAIQKDSEFAQLSAGIIYMGGVFDVAGDELPESEYNWWYDPHAVNVCLQADWKSQLVVPHDAATKCLRGKDVYQLYKSNNSSVITQLMLDDLSGIYEKGKTEDLLYCWDPITVGALLAPSLITSRETRDVIVDDTMGHTYGSSFSWKEGEGPDDASTVDIVFEVDRDAFWNFLVSLYAIPD